MMKYQKYEKRGMFFEELINQTITFYRENDIALFHKQNLSITFANIKEIEGKKYIENGYIKNRSTIDYYGNYKGRFVAFEAKSTNLKSLPLKNIKQHQLDYLIKTDQHGGFAFFLIYYNRFNQIFMLLVKKLQLLPKKRKSIPMEFAIEHGIEINVSFPGIINFVCFIKN